jgi:carboxypeptidase family protein/TonB-dependent receptor-like protein
LSKILQAETHDGIRASYKRMSIQAPVRASSGWQLLFALILFVPLAVAQTGLTGSSTMPQVRDLTGQVVGEQGEPIPGAVCTLKATRHGDLPEEGVTVTTDEKGNFKFPGLVLGTYDLYCGAVARQTVAQSGIEVAEGQATFVQVTLPAEIRRRERVEVRGQVEGVSPQAPAPPTTVTAPQLQTLPLTQQKFKAALPLVPGVVRTPDGKINIKGIGESQSLLLVDSAETVDPVTGAFAIEVPIDAIESIDVFKSAYRAEFGRFSGGVTSIETKPPSGQFHFELNDLLPTVRVKSGHIVGIADDGPRLTFTGPILANRLNFSESIIYEMVKQPVRGLAWPHNETKSEGFNSFSSFQYIFSPQHLFTVNVNAFPLKREFADINSLVPQSASSNYGQQGFSVAATDRYLFSSGGALTTLVQNIKFDSNAYGQGPLDMLVTPNGWGGNFFNQYTRTSSQQELQDTYQFPNQGWHGRHELKAGVDFVRRAYNGTSLSHPVQLLRPDGSTAEQIDFQSAGKLSVVDSEGAAFVQDHWVLNDQLAIDTGLRFSAQTVGEPSAFAPRWGVAYTPRGDGKTIFRGGVGIFYDRVPLLAGDFIANPTRVVTCFDPECGPLGSVIVFTNSYIKVDEKGHRIVPSRNRLDSTPYNVTWNAEVDREILPHVVLRLNYLSSRTYQVFVTDPQNLPGSIPVLLLSNTGGSRYHEFESTLRVRASENADVNFSYVHSLAHGDLNTMGQVFVPFEQPVIRPNVFADLPSNIPNRVVTWGQFKIPWQVTASPIFDVHTGFPYSAVDVLENYVGKPNSLRFPSFLSLDLKLSKDFHLPFAPWLKRHKFRGAIAIYNVTNHANPRDVFNNVASPFYGQFVGFQHRSLETWFDILY